MSVPSFYELDSTLETEWYGKVFKEIVRRDGFSSNIIENYNNEMLNKIPALIKSTQFETRNGYITFDNIGYHPVREIEKGEIVYLYPKNARQKTIPYFAEIYADVIFTPKVVARLPSGEVQYMNNAKPEIKKEFELGKVPVMLGSQLCHLYGLSEEQRMEKGECFNDPLGYFIVKSERVILSQVGLRLSTFLIYKLKESKDASKESAVVGKITCPTEQGTCVVELYIQSKIKSVRVMLQHIKKQNNPSGRGYPIFLIYKILGMEVEDAIDQIKKFILKENHTQLDYYIKSSIAEFDSLNLNSIDDCIEYVKTFRNDLERDREISREQIIPDIINQLFYDMKKPEDRLEHLSMYAARIFEYIMGIRTIDDRDSWSNIYILTAGKKISDLFKSIWSDIKKRITPKVALNDGIKSFTNEFLHTDIRDNFISAFGPNAWGLKRSMKSAKIGENITESLKRDTPVAVFSQITKVNSAASRQAKKDEPRMVHPSQLGFVCCFETPEGEGCGLIKNLATTCYISLNRDPAIFQAMLKPYGPLGKFVSKDKENDNQVPLLINGIINGWCIPDIIVPELKKMRKQNNEIQKDVCIFYNRNNRCVEIYCDGGRPTRPLFVVDSDGQLVILKKRLLDADIPTLIREGCIEYIDAREQEYIMLAQRPEQIIERNKQYDDLKSLKPQEEKLDKYIPYIGTLLSQLSEIVPESQYKTLSKLIEMYNEIGKATDSNEQEEILTNVAIKLSSFTKEVNSDIFPENIYKEIESDSQEYRLFELEKNVPFTHCEIDPISMFSLSSNLVPMANRQAGPRTGYQAGMNKQALGQYHSNEAERFDSSYKMIYYPTKALFQNDLQEEIGLNAMPNGQTLSVAIMALPDNPEDGIIFKEEAVKYGCKFDMCKKMTTISIAKSTNETVESFERPPIQPGKDSLFQAIDENGLPRLDAFIRQGDCIIGKVRRYTKDPLKAGEIENVCEYAGVGEDGYVDRILITFNGAGEKVVKVKIRKNRKYIPGDKLASRYSQKGTVSRIIPSRFLPRIASGPNKGVVPDIFINPHGQPSRMTLNKIIEIRATKAAAIAGVFFNSTTFRKGVQGEMYPGQFFIDKTLEDYGLNSSGKEKFEVPLSDGTMFPLENEIFFGLCHYQALRHHVSDKIQMRARQGVKANTRQPVSGRSKEGGLRVGEMERDALISHGGSALLRERLCDVSDAYTLPICQTCGTIAITDHKNNINECRICGPNKKIGTIRIPYVVKLLLFYLNACGIHMTFRTENAIPENSRPEEIALL